MADSIEAALKELDAWYNDVQGSDADRPKFLAKLATLEFCGWLETRLDELIRLASTECGANIEWVEKVIDRTNGFHYDDHFRRMLCQVLGEVFVTKLETRIELTHPGDIEVLKNTLGNLWALRGALAHTNTGAPMKKQITLNAPSWSINQQRVLAKILIRYEAGLQQFTNVLGKIQ